MCIRDRFNLLLLVLAWSIVGVAYQSNDDLVIASVLDGWGDPSYACLLYTSRKG